MSTHPALIVKTVSGLQPYDTIWSQMRAFTHARNQEKPSADEIWFLEHAPVFTQGQAGKPEHILSNEHNIPLVQSDRGGQVTYHGPGQLMIYLLLNLKNYGFYAKTYVQFLEQAIITLLKKYDIPSFTQENAPGVYVCLPHSSEIKKIASIGIRIRKNFSYHGICLNISGDLSPFKFINPCGYKNLAMAQLSDFESTKNLSTEQVIQDLTHYFKTTFSLLYQEAPNHV
jgi:lipoyl(octanoyl) transferase